MKTCCPFALPGTLCVTTGGDNDGSVEAGRLGESDGMTGRFFGPIAGPLVSQRRLSDPICHQGISTATRAVEALPVTRRKPAREVGNGGLRRELGKDGTVGHIGGGLQCDRCPDGRFQPKVVRAATARININTRFSAKQQASLGFLLQRYVTVSVEKRDEENLTPRSRLRYHDSGANAVAELGRPEQSGQVFADLPRYR